MCTHMRVHTCMGVCLSGVCLACMCVYACMCVARARTCTHGHACVFMCAYGCVCACMNTCMCARACICAHVHACVHVCGLPCARVRVCICACMRVHVRVHGCACAPVCIFMCVHVGCVCMCVRMCACMHPQVHGHKSRAAGHASALSPPHWQPDPGVFCTALAPEASGAGRERARVDRHPCPALRRQCGSNIMSEDRPCHSGQPCWTKLRDAGESPSLGFVERASVDSRWPRVLRGCFFLLWARAPASPGSLCPCLSHPHMPAVGGGQTRDSQVFFPKSVFY